MSNIEFGQWLRNKREEARQSQTEIARKLSVLPAHISRIEKGERGPSMELLVKIAGLYQTPVDNLIHLVSGIKSKKKAPGEQLEEKIKSIDAIVSELPLSEAQDVLEFARYRLRQIEERREREKREANNAAKKSGRSTTQAGGV